MKLYNIYYIDDTYGEPLSYQVTTDNPKEWLEEHNKQRIADGNDVEKLEYFEIQEVCLITYDKTTTIAEKRRTRWILSKY